MPALIMSAASSSAVARRPPTGSKLLFQRIDSYCHKMKNEGYSMLIPDSLIHDLVTKELCEQILAEFSLVELHDRVEEILSHYRKILTVLVLLRMEEWIVNFVNRRCTDRKLPLTKHQLNGVDASRTLSESSFVRKQYLCLAPPLEQSMRSDYQSDLIFPILKETELGSGGFGTVWKIKVHPDYDRLSDDEQALGHGEYNSLADAHCYALKILHSNDDDPRERKRVEQEFHNEVHAGTRLRLLGNPNITPLLTSYKYGEKYHLVFPYCECNLRQFLEKRRPRGIEVPGVPRLRLLEQIARLLSALYAIHNCEAVDGNGGKYYGYHRDLKPQNILKKGDTFMIADFGLTRFSPAKAQAQRTATDQQTGFEWSFNIGTYQAPECERSGKKKIGRRADIWSLGCILAEVITYIVQGEGGVRKFRDRRHQKISLGEGSATVTNDYFHDGEAKTATLKKDVLEWLDGLSEGNMVVKKVCDLVKRMLAERPKKRPVARAVYGNLRNILREEADRLGVDITLKELRYDREEFKRKTMEWMARVSEIKKALAGPIRSVTFHAVRNPEDYSFSRANSLDPALNRPFSPQTEDSFKLLDIMDTMFLIDDSHSMFESEVWDKTRRSLSEFANIGTKHDPDGVDIAFVQSSIEEQSLATTKAVMDAFHQVKRERCDQNENTERKTLAAKLNQILDDYYWLYESDPTSTNPLNLIVLTRGDVGKSGIDELDEVITKWARTLDNRDDVPSYQLGIQFVLIGNSKDARPGFWYLDEELAHTRGVRDIVDHTTFNPDMVEPDRREKILCKIMCGGLVKALDQKQDICNSPLSSPILQHPAPEHRLFDSHPYTDCVVGSPS